MATLAHRALNGSWNASSLTGEIIHRDTRREQRPRPIGRLHDDRDQRQRRDDAVTPRKEIRPDRNPRRLLSHRASARLDDRIEERRVIAGIWVRKPSRKYRDRSPSRTQRAAVGLSIDAARTT